jgi:Mrp family chromosome partitioning ATPase
LSDLYASKRIDDLSKTIQATETSHLYVLSSGRSRVSPVALFDSEDFRRISVSLRRTFRFVIVDGPPLLKHPDALQLARHVDGVVLVVRQKRLTREVVRKGIEQLQAIHAPLIGAILNQRRFAIPTLIYKLIS